MNTNLKKTVRIVKKNVKKFRREVGVSMVATLATAALLPYAVKLVRRGGKDHDDAIVLTSLLCETRITPKKEDSNVERTLIELKLRELDEIRSSLKSLRSK